MRSTMLAGPLLVLLWQAAPVHVQPDSAGRLRVAFGYGAAQFEERHFNCAGDLIGVEAHPFRSSGAQLEYWPHQRLRLSGFGGVISTGLAHSYGGGVIAFEGQGVGVGAGSVWMPGDHYPSLYVRFGDLDKLHFRFDVGSPTPAYPTTGWTRLGLAFKQGHLRSLSGMLGVGAGGYGPHGDGSVSMGPFAEFALPLSSEFDLTIGGTIRPSHRYTDWGLALGGRLHLRP